MPTHFSRVIDAVRACAFAFMAIASVGFVVAILVAVSARDDVDRRVAPSTMSAAGSGEVDVPPTEAALAVSLKGCAQGPSSSLLDANNSLAALTKALRGADVPARDISQSGTQTYRTYGARAAWCTNLDVAVRVQDLDLLDEAILALGRSRRGITGIEGPIFDYGAEGSLERRALADAVAAARAKADDAAKRTGMRVTGVQSIRERSSQVERPNERSMRFNASSLESDGAYKSAAGAAADVVAVSRNSGQATATARVDVVFTLERDA